MYVNRHVEYEFITITAGSIFPAPDGQKMPEIICRIKEKMYKILTKLLLFAVIVFFNAQAIAIDFKLGTPPTAPLDLKGLSLSTLEKTYSKLLEKTQATPAVNPKNRASSLNFYNSYYLASGSQDISWTGNRNTCTAGTTASNFKDAVALRINYFRAMAGVPSAIVFSATYSAKDQEAALMMSVNQQLDHEPPDTWACYTANGAEAAGKSNLALGVCGWDCISGYMKDPGSGNGAAGHRRWILYPQTQNMGTGDIPPSGGWASNALWAYDSNYGGPRPATREEYVAWPPPGYVPYQMVYPRWSFSYANADFSSAMVTMIEDGVTVSTALEAVHTGYGENTVVWIPKGMSSGDYWPQPSANTKYHVTVSNVLIGGSPRSFTYDVTVFDPAAPPPVSSHNPVYLLLLNN